MILEDDCQGGEGGRGGGEDGDEEVGGSKPEMRGGVFFVWKDLYTEVSEAVACTEVEHVGYSLVFYVVRNYI